ncbi:MULTISPECIES: DUF3039 domain-containing protein [Glycomyces]|uniref:DUF3039 domain-containing protein n=2 Tax=Glycomyces TaxID=58113 RepID=A0A9X3PJ44_9ACTN|nr:DUF3039 domain-containing protein [Glycomyces lechevalierae]MDA1384949.1 DUF3039 domain-containing protein [Glycomyces lechevalierae]MDR7337599.1 hypothetical protein [Glycomyces lechevalierae]
MSELPTTGGTEGGGSTLLEEQTQTNPNYTYEDGDEERFSHYVPKDKLMAAMIDGVPVKALCGKMWVPTRDPDRFPICPNCKDIYEKMKS